MKNFFIIIGLIFFSAYCVDGQSNSQKNNFTSVSAEQFNKLVQTGNYIVLDVRTSKEYDEGHILSSINIDFFNKNFDQSVIVYKDKPVLIYSRSSAQSTQAMERLASLNFQEVTELENGLVAWKRSGFSMVK